MTSRIVTVLAVLVLSAALWADVAEEARVERGQQVRAVLVDALEQAYENDGVWPQELSLPPDAPQLVYLRPEKFDDTALGRELAAAVVVLHETLDQHPEGVWVGYAAGHMGFAPDAESLADCLNQIEIARAAIEAHGSLSFRSATAEGRLEAPDEGAGELKLRILDPDGLQPHGAMIGMFLQFGDWYASNARTYFVRGMPPRERVTIISDQEGTSVVAASDVFYARFAYEPEAMLCIIHERHELMAFETVTRSDFGTGEVREVRLQPAAKVAVRATNAALRGSGAGMMTTVFRLGRFGLLMIEAGSTVDHLEVLLPPGDYGMWVRAADSEPAFRYFRIEPGQRELNLQIDLPPTRLAQLTGQPAPELRQIKGWQNTEPLSLAELRGKVVLLGFWGYWCHPCIVAMPGLMELYDEALFYQNAPYVVRLSTGNHANHYWSLTTRSKTRLLRDGHGHHCLLNTIYRPITRRNVSQDGQLPSGRIMAYPACGSEPK